MHCCRLLYDDQRESGLLSVLSRLVKGFSHRHQPRSHAADLVVAIHVLLRLLERLSSKGLALYRPSFVALICRLSS